MILIQSEKSDNTTDQVIDWIEHLRKSDFKRINPEDVIVEFAISLDNSIEKVALKFDNAIINLNSIDAFWYRRGQFQFGYPNFKLTNEHMDIQAEIEKFIETEIKVADAYIHSLLKKKKSINHFNDVNRQQKVD